MFFLALFRSCGWAAVSGFGSLEVCGYSKAALPKLENFHRQVHPKFPHPGFFLSSQQLEKKSSLWWAKNCVNSKPSSERFSVSSLLCFRDLWKLRAEFFGISSSILSSCVSASYSLGLGQLSSKMLSPTLLPPSPSYFTLLSCNLYLSPPDTSSGVHSLLTSSLGRLAAREMEQHEEENDSVESKGEELKDKMKQQEIIALKHLHKEAVFQLNER